jgi:hypothetical protein
MNPFDSFVFLSLMRKSSNALVTFSDRICFEYGEKRHYVNKCSQRRLKDQPTETDIATTQTIQCSNSYESQVIGKQNVHRPQALRMQHILQLRENATIVEKRDTLLMRAPIHIHILLFHHQQRQHPITKEVLRQSKRPRHVSIMDMLVILPIDAPTCVNYRPPTQGN